MIEPDVTQSGFLKQNIQLLKTNKCQLYVTTAQKALQKINQQFDLVFLDPPYGLNLWQELAESVDTKIVVNGFIYVEADRELSELKLPASWKKIKETKAGIVKAGLYQKMP